MAGWFGFPCFTSFRWRFSCGVSVFHFTARWQLLTGVPTVLSGQDNLEVPMSCRHQITTRESPKKRRHSISITTYSPFMGISGKKEEVHLRMWMYEWNLFSGSKIWIFICCGSTLVHAIFFSFPKFSPRIFLKSSVSCCCHPDDASTLSPSCLLAAAWEKISAFYGLKNNEIWNLVSLSILDE